MLFFSSRRRHTRWPRDWSSDVCSSDLSEVDGGGLGGGVKTVVGSASGVGAGGVQQQLPLCLGEIGKSGAGDVDRCEIVDPQEIGRASLGKEGREGGWAVECMRTERRTA